MPAIIPAFVVFAIEENRTESLILFINTVAGAVIFVVYIKDAVSATIKSFSLL